ncbi:helix-turn-helix domain-containing protein [Paenibacillus rigui]|uniref:HTH araC/xylS-type domain-containing protein n=1 Tax=Paenibacillus rigui TaxID=554312 RepID=A0A229UUD2_9BACL|nr:helix-turn-helix domain-containing protein [Paenibacillus rigui]OXM86990.1 hypothetical protein CF651_07560 [Paenibacillus rigui]
MKMHPSPLQFGFELETDKYIEKFKTYGSHTILYYQFTMGATEHLPVVPDGCIDLLFHCYPSRPTALICGSVLQMEQIPFHARSDYFGVRFTSRHSLLLRQQLFRETINRQISLDSVVKGAAGCADGFMEKLHFEERITRFEQRLLPMLIEAEAPQGLVDYCVNRIHQTLGNVGINDLAEESGYSSRYVRKRFEDRLGISPKLYSRIIRFQHVLYYVMKQYTMLTDAVNLQGYYDQSHFVKEFKQFTLITPMQMVHKVRQAQG